MSTALDDSRRSLMNYSKQINDAHKACQDAKILGGQKAHECGTWLLKQKEVLPHGQWMGWVKANCKFDQTQACRYIAIAGLDFARVQNLSIRGALWEVAEEKAFDDAMKEGGKRAEAEGVPAPWCVAPMGESELSVQ